MKVGAGSARAAAPVRAIPELVKASSGKTVTGFEFATAATVHPDVQGAANNPARAMCLAMDAGLAAGVDFIEVYQEDASSDDPAVQKVLQAAAKKLDVPSGQRDRSAKASPLGPC